MSEEQIMTPTPWLRKPRLDECDHRIRFGNRYRFTCFVLTEERRDAYPREREDIRLYPLTEAGRDAATADLAAIEADKRKLEREKCRTELLAGIQRKECRFCRYHPAKATRTDFGSFFVCETRRGGFAERIVNPTDTCDGFTVADKYKEQLSKGN